MCKHIDKIRELHPIQEETIVTHLSKTCHWCIKTEAFTGIFLALVSIQYLVDTLEGKHDEDTDMAKEYLLGL